MTAPAAPAAPPVTPPPDLATTFPGDSEMAARCRALDWAGTALGPAAAWPAALRAVVRTCLESPFPVNLWCGDALVLIYNDAYRRVLGAKHPDALGRPGLEVWAEIRGDLEPMFAGLRAGGPPVYAEDARFVMARAGEGPGEDAYFTFGLSPVRDDGGHVVAFFNPAAETTARVRTDRAYAVERARLAEVFRRSPSFAAVYRGPAHVFEFVNEAYYGLVGHRPVLGLPLDQAIPEAREQGFLAILDRVLTTGEPWTGRETPVWIQRVPNAPRDLRYVDLVFQPLVEADGTRSGVLAHGVDITEQVLARREAERLLVESERARGAAEAARVDAERAAARTAQLQALTAALAGARTVDEVAAVVVAEAVAATGAATGMLAVRVAAEAGGAPGAADEAVIVRHAGLAPSVVGRYARFPLDAPGPAARCLRTGEAQWAESRDELLARYPDALPTWNALGTHAVATVPLAVAGPGGAPTAVGAMSYTWTSPRPLGPDDRAFFLALGRQAAQAVERARLFEAEHAARAEAERRGEELAAAERRARFLADLGQALQPITDPDALMATSARLLGTHLGADRCAYAEVEADEDHFVVTGDYTQGGTPSIVGRWAMRAFGAEALRLMRADRVYVVDDVAADPRVAPEDRTAYAQAQIGAVVCVPLHKAGRFVAGMAVHQRGPRPWAADEVALVVTVVQRCWESLERARAQRAVEAANAAKGQFLANMSHELRTPLNAIGGYVQLLEMGLHGPVTDAQREALGRVGRAQRHLLGLINDILNYARLGSGRVEYDVRAVRVADMLGDVLPLVEPQAAARGLTLARALPEDRGAPPVRVRADREKLGQALLNLLSNAVKFTEPGGRVTVALDAAPGAGVAHLRVADTGRGIPPDKLEAVFEPFVQVGKAYAGEAPGTGLGLAISRDLARGMGGDLTVESAPGVGSVFTITLPMGDRPPGGA